MPENAAGHIAGARPGFLDRPGCRIYYEVTGTGPAIVFAHGLGGTYLSWWQQVGHFADRFTCVTFSHRGFYPSSEIPGGPDPADYPADLAALIEHLGLPDVRLVAQSMGGWSAIEYALARPNMVRALVLASTSGTIERRASLLAEPQRLADWTRHAAALGAEMQRRGIHPAAGILMAEEQPALHFLYRAISGMSTLDRDALRGRLGKTSNRPPEQLSRIATPTLFVTGDEDTVFPSMLAQPMAALMPNARAVEVRQAAHSVHFERAETFNRLLAEFLKTVG